MVFIFEDRETDLLSELFRVPYRDTSNFIYANGNGGLLRELRECIAKGYEHIVIFIDLIYDNKNTAQTYKQLIRYIKEKELNHVIVLPLICAEYYMIKSIYNTYKLPKTENSETCVNLDNWRNTYLVSDVESKLYCKNFEKYCKLLLNKEAIDCIKHTKNSPKYSLYYTQRCLCETAEADCREDTLLRKAIAYLTQYRAVPSGVSNAIKEDINIEELMNIHKELVDEYNNIVEKHRKLDPENKSNYKRIPYMR